jgi:hypothetical protein
MITTTDTIRYFFVLNNQNIIILNENLRIAKSQIPKRTALLPTRF